MSGLNRFGSAKILEITRKFGEKVVEVASIHTMAKNLPHRAAFVLRNISVDSNRIFEPDVPG